MIKICRCVNDGEAGGAVTESWPDTGMNAGRGFVRGMGVYACAGAPRSPSHACVV